MYAKPNPLQIILNPPGLQLGMPGDTIELHAVVINQGDQSAVVDLSFIFDEEFKNVTGWSIPPQESLAIAPQQTSDEVTFAFQIPIDALPGTYDYTLVVDAPEHYPQDTPINFPLQLKVLLKEQTVVRVNDPTFSLKPSTNANKPQILNLSEPLQVEVTVENRSGRVDRFRLTCPDLDEDWFTITYPTTGVEGLGLSDVNALSLNPASKGQILLTLHPPADTLAGSYSPTVRLHSENLPDLVLLDLVYIQIPTIYRLDVQLHTILAQVSRSPGKYELALVNQGNVVRELRFSLESRDEEQLYTYKFDPDEIKLLPNNSSAANLTVNPRPWWRRPWLGGGLIVNFKVNIQDQQGLPLPNTLPQGSLIWKPRPWWQLLLLILIGLGLVGGIGFIIWRLLHPDPVRLENFAANSSQITEGEDEVTLKWDIQNYQQLQKLQLIIKSQQPVKAITYDFSKGIPDELGKRNTGEIPPCIVQQRSELSCSNVKTGVKARGNYTFELQGVYRKGMPLFSRTTKTELQTVQVAISEKPIAEVVEFKTDKPQYRKGDRINLSWIIARPFLLREIQVTGNAEDGTSTGSIFGYKFNQGKINDPRLQGLCQEKENQQLQCSNIPIVASRAGKFTFEIKAFPNNGSEKFSAKKTENAIEILAKPFRIVSFTINGSEAGNQVLKEGDTATLSWQVEGEDIQVKLLPYGDVKPSGTMQLPVILEFPPQIILQVSDVAGKQQPQQKGFAIAVTKKPEPTPIAPIAPIAPVPNNQPVPPRTP